MASEKFRLDQLLVNRGLFDSREQARRMVMAGKVLVGDQIVDKPGQKLKSDVEIRLKEIPRFVSRGGEKLAGYLETKNFRLEGLKVMDVGASTGGFTDFCLQNGCHSVIAVDVGTNQLHWKLRQDQRVLSLEKTHICHLKKEDLPFAVDGFVMDVSFISLHKVMPELPKFANPDHFLIALFKPQFEVGRKYLSKKGVVQDEKIIEQKLSEFCQKLLDLGYGLVALEASTLPGPKGNIEFLIHAMAGDTSANILTDDLGFKTAKIADFVNFAMKQRKAMLDHNQN